MKSLLLSLLFTAFTIVVNAQNCGTVIDFTANIVNNNNGTHNYTFFVTFQATSGGSKSVRMTIQCGNQVFLSNVCETSLATTRVVSFGPFTSATCTDGIVLVWSGHTNAACGGTTCNPTQTLPLAQQLPVELTSFQAVAEAGKVKLDWSTASETNNEKFVLERSRDGVNYQNIGEVAGNGSTTEINHYRFLDERPFTGISYYRLQQFDYDGNFTYSPVASVQVRNGSDIQMYPTIVQHELQILLPEEADEATEIKIFSVHGRLVFHQLVAGGGLLTVALPAMAEGQYVVEVLNGSTYKRAQIFKR